MKRNTKIVATIGPASRSKQVILELLQAGVDIIRLNFSHGTYDQHEEMIHSIREISQELGKPVAILQDLQGPKLRVGELSQTGITLLHGQEVWMSSINEQETIFSQQNGIPLIPIDIPNLSKSVQIGNRILLDDGNLELEVSDISGQTIRTKVITGGKLTSHKGINLPGAPLLFSSFTPKDEADLKFGLSQGIDAVAISFVRSAKDIQTVRQAIHDYSPDLSDTPIIAKIERPEAFEHLDEILETADGIMVARGDLAVETSPAKVPTMQKRMIQKAFKKAKLVITATQMLESMINNPRPTRAEASDIANAIYDGTDAIMLSAETAAGKYPVEAVQMMVSIVEEAEHHVNEWGHCTQLSDESTDDDAISITRATRELAHDRNVSGIAVFSVSGRTGLLMSKARPQVPITAFTPYQRTYYRLNLFWGVTPVLGPFANNVEGMLSNVEAAMLGLGFTPGDQVIVISGYPIGCAYPPNLMMLYTLHAK